MTIYKSKCPMCAKLVDGYRAPGNSRMVKFDCCNLSWARPMFMEPEPSDPADDVAVRIDSLTLALTRAEKAEADNAALLAALKETGVHHEDCPVLQIQDDGGDGECDCELWIVTESHPGAGILRRLEAAEAALGVQSQMLEATQKERDEHLARIRNLRDDLAAVLIREAEVVARLARIEEAEKERDEARTRLTDMREAFASSSTDEENRLRARLARIEAAAQYFADIYPGGVNKDVKDSAWTLNVISMDKVSVLRAALKPETKKEGKP